MGRRPDPAAVKAKKAAVRSTKAPPVETTDVPIAEASSRTPAGLKGQALAIWQKQAPILRAQRLLSAVDEPAFARYCRNYGRWLLEREKLDKRGYTYDASTTTGGKLRRADPSFLIADRLERQLLALEDRFGMNPSSRQRIVMQRAAGNRPGELPLDDPRKPGDSAAQPADAAQPVASPIGMLN